MVKNVDLTIDVHTVGQEITPTCIVTAGNNPEGVGPQAEPLPKRGKGETKTEKNTITKHNLIHSRTATKQPRNFVLREF